MFPGLLPTEEVDPGMLDYARSAAAGVWACVLPFLGMPIKGCSCTTWGLASCARDMRRQGRGGGRKPAASALLHRSPGQVSSPWREPILSVLFAGSSVTQHLFPGESLPCHGLPGVELHCQWSSSVVGLSSYPEAGILSRSEREAYPQWLCIPTGLPWELDQHPGPPQRHNIPRPRLSLYPSALVTASSVLLLPLPQGDQMGCLNPVKGLHCSGSGEVMPRASGGHPGEQRLKGWQESHTPTEVHPGHRLTSAAANKGHFPIAGLLNRDGLPLSTGSCCSWDSQPVLGTLQFPSPAFSCQLL